MRKLVALDPNDPLSRFAIGRKLAQGNHGAAWEEAAEHLAFANHVARGHMATYHVLGELLIRLGRRAEVRRVLESGMARGAGVGEGMGRDLGPAMAELLARIGQAVG